MRSTKLSTWITWALVLFALGVATDYYFLHILFQQKQQEAAQVAEGDPEAATSPAAETAVADESFLGEKGNTPAQADSGKDTFLESLQTCAPEVAAQTIATPEALMEYLQKSVGIAKEEISLENYHLALPDGSLRRVHLITADNTNSKDKVEIRFFKLDEEGYPERLALKGDETLESLLALGKVSKHEVKSSLELKDKTSVSLEKHDNVVYEFQYNNHGKILSCRYKECLCQ